ncbi:MAG: HNH endonuclease [Terriglobales bacterium]
MRVWDAAWTLDTPLAQLIRDLRQNVLAPDPDYKAIEGSASRVSEAFGTDGDPLPLVEQQLALTEAPLEPPPLTKPAQFTHQADFGVEDDISPSMARIERVKQWRLQAVRGSAGVQFRRDVSAKYEYRCAFSGHRLPKLEVTESPGVDSAHILPWSTHEINSVRNGLCLSKQCHWAFDQGILRLTFDEPSRTYLLDIPDKIRRAAQKTKFDLEYFDALSGPIPEARLPKNRAHWPSPAYIGELNQFVFQR